METISKEGIKRLHDTLNDGLFNGELARAYIPQIGRTYNKRDIEIGITKLGKKHLACYQYIDNKDELLSHEIIFDIDFLQEIDGMSDKEKQVGIIASTLLHEMIHQHLSEAGEKVTRNNMHGKRFVQDGLQHGYAYLLGACIDSGFEGNPPEQKFRHERYDLLPVAEKVIEGFQF